MTDIRHHLEIMLDVLDGKEWIQGDLFQGPHGLRGDQFAVPVPDVTGVCLAGSYTYAMVSGALEMNEYNWPLVSSFLLAVIEDLFPDRLVASIPYFNDLKETTVEDIRLVVKTAIERASELH